MKIGTAEITKTAIMEASRFGCNLRGVCDYLNKERPDLKAEWIIQIEREINRDCWIVVYRWPG